MTELDFLPFALAQEARIYEGEPYWSLNRTRDVIDAIARAGRAVIGIEQMRFEPGFAGPRVLRVFSFRVKSTVPWPQVVADAREKAYAELSRMSGEDTVCQIAWLAGP